MTTRKQSVKRKSTAAADQDIVGLITTLVQKLVSLEAKIDTVLSRTSARPFEPPRQQPSPGSPAGQYRDARPMYRAVCADCRKACEVPFKPSGDRPVYCKDCFAKRKAARPFSGRPDISPRQTPPPQAPVAEKPHPASAAKAKAVTKKKAAPKRRKK